MIRLLRMPIKALTGALLLLTIFSMGGICGKESSHGPKKILLIHSYHAEYPWVAAISRGVAKAVHGKNILIETYYMDTKRNTSLEFKVEAGRLAIERINKWNPDIVITSDDNAQIYVTKRFVGKRPYFVFCGVNADPKEYGFPASNVTGIAEHPHFGESINFLHEIAPFVKTIAVLSDDDPTSVGALTFMQNEETGIKVVSYKLTDAFEQWERRIKEDNTSVDAVAIYMYHTLKEKKSRTSMDPKKVMEWTVDNCRLPTVGFFEFAVEDGLLCGVAESGEEHGFEAGEMALQLLDGADVRSLPIRYAKKGIRMINMKTAEKLGIVIPDEVLRSADRVIR